MRNGLRSIRKRLGAEEYRKKYIVLVQRMIEGLYWKDRVLLVRKGEKKHDLKALKTSK